MEQHLKAEFLNVRTIAPTSGALYLWMKGLTFSLTRETPEWGIGFGLLGLGISGLLGLQMTGERASAGCGER